MAKTLHSAIGTLVNAFSFNKVILFPNVALVIALQPAKAYSLIVVTALGITISVKEEHPLNVYEFILVKFCGRMIAFKDVHPENADSISVTASGMLIFSKALHPLNALDFIIVTPSGITISLIDIQALNALMPIDVDFSFMVTFTKDLQDHSTSSFAITFVALVKDVQKKYLQPVITQYFASNKSEIWS